MLPMTLGRCRPRLHAMAILDAGQLPKFHPGQRRKRCPLSAGRAYTQAEPNRNLVGINCRTGWLSYCGRAIGQRSWTPLRRETDPFPEQNNAGVRHTSRESLL